MSSYETKRVFSINLSNLLSSRKETQAELAAAMGVAPSSVSAWCTGDKMPRMDKIEWLAGHFGVNVSVLLGGEDNTRSASPTPALNNVYLSFAQEAQDKNIDPEDIREALELIEKLKHKRK